MATTIFYSNFDSEELNLKQQTEKATWDDIYDDFKRRHPTWSKIVLGFKPFGYATIMIMCPDRVKLVYDYNTKIAKFIDNESAQKFI